MTPRSIVLLTLAGLTPAATAQTPTLRFTADTTDPGSFGTVNWTVSITGVPGFGAYVQVYDLDILASIGGFSNTTPFADGLLNLISPTPGTPIDGSIFGASGGQSPLLDPLGTVYGDVVIGTFSVTSDGPKLGLTYDIADGGNFTTSHIRIRDNSLGPVIFDGRPNVVSDVVNFTPAPTSAFIIGSLGVCAIRRRRR